MLSRMALKDMFATLRNATRACFTYIYISKRYSDFANSRGFYFQEVLRKLIILVKIIIYRSSANWQCLWHMVCSVPIRCKISRFLKQLITCQLPSSFAQLNVVQYLYAYRH